MNMKRFLLITLSACAAIGISSCSKTLSLLNKTFTFQLPAQNFSIPPVPDSVALVSGYMPAISGAFTYNLDSCIKANTGNALGVNNIGSFKITSCVITLNNPDSVNNLSAFQSLNLAFTSTAVSGTYSLGFDQPNVYAATMTLAPADTSADMKNYLQGSNFNYSIKGQMRKGTTDTMQCNAVFNVTVRVQG
jgi:hypothetical protein